MREAFERESRAPNMKRLLVTSAVAGGKDKIDKGYDVRQLAM